MPDFDGGFKIAARASPKELCRVAHLHADDLEPIGDTLQTTERLADRAFRARAGNERFVVYFEGYTRWTDDALWSILAKSGLLSERERLPTRTVVFVLTPQRYREQDGVFSLTVEREQTQYLRFYPVCLWREQPQPWWDKVPGLMALFPLCAHNLPESEAICHAAQTIKRQVKDTVVRADLLTTLGVFGRLVYRQGDAMDLIGREFMRESKFFDEIIALGRVEQSRANILELLAMRLGSGAAEQFTQALDKITDLNKLSELHRVAAKTRSLSVFRRALASASA